MAAWVDINEVVSAYLDENELSNNKRFRLWQLAFRGMEQLGLDAFFKVQSFEVEVNSNQIAQIPPECITLLKVGALNSNGEISSFVESDSNGNFCNTDGLASYCFNSYWNDGAWCNILCNRASLCEGFIKVKKEEGIIELSGFTSLGGLMVEGVVAPEMNGEYRIPVQFKQPLIAWMDWRLLPKNAKGSGVWRTMKNDFYNERRLAIARYKPFIIKNHNHIHGYTH